MPGADAGLPIKGNSWDADGRVTCAPPGGHGLAFRNCCGHEHCLPAAHRSQGQAEVESRCEDTRMRPRGYVGAASFFFFFFFFSTSFSSLGFPAWWIPQASSCGISLAYHGGGHCAPCRGAGSFRFHLMAVTIDAEKNQLPTDFSRFRRQNPNVSTRTTRAW